MRRLVTGVDAAGRSCVTGGANFELPVVGDLGIRSAVAASTTSCPPPPRTLDGSELHDLALAPGLIRWAIAEFPPNLFLPRHATNTVDFDTVLEGAIEIGLDDGQHLLERGDVVIVNGVGHSWTAGPRGCRVSFLQIGTPPPDRATR